MKKINTCFAMVMFAMAMVGCQEDFDGILTATIEDYRGGNSKVYIEEGATFDAPNYACWHNGDRVKVNGMDYPVVIADGGGATINVDAQYGNGVTEFTAVYPAGLVASMTEGHCVLNLPMEQTYQVNVRPNGGMVQTVDAPMMAYTKGNALRFLNTGALVKVAVYNRKAVGIKVQQIVLTALTEGTKLWGKASFQQSLGNTPVMSSIAHGGNMVKMTIPNNLGSIVANGQQSFYIAVPVVRSKIRLNVQYVREGDATESTTYIRESRNENSITRNMIAVMHVELK